MSGNSTPNDDEPGILIEPVDSRTDAERTRAQEMTREEKRRFLEGQGDEKWLDPESSTKPRPPDPGSTPSNVRRLRP